MTQVLEAVERPSPQGEPAARRRNVLAEIARRRRADIAAELRGVTGRELRRRAEAAPPPRDAVAALLRPGLHLIAEVKRRSPSAGSLAPRGGEMVARARAYREGGAVAVSVLVEPHWFGGSLDDLRAVRVAIELPVLAKEFVVDPRQLPLLRSAGADLCLMLAALHPRRRLADLVRDARDVGLEPFVEAHSERELDDALATGARLIGLNSRDLRTLQIDPDRVVALRGLVPDDRLVVAESGIRRPRELASLRALGFDGALIGETLMREPAWVAATTAAFVAAGREPAPAEDPAAAHRAATVKICGVTDREGVLAAARAGADAIGLNFVPGTRRALAEHEAAELVTLARAVAPGSRRLRVLGIFADADPGAINALADRLDLDGVQLSGDEHEAEVARITRRVTKVLHAPAATEGQPIEEVAEDAAARARTWLAVGNVGDLVLDAGDGVERGGTGRRVDGGLAAIVARAVPVTLAGGLDPRNVAEALRLIPAVGVDVSSGVEAGRTNAAGRAAKDPFLVGLFVKRARAARIDRPQVGSRPEPVDRGLVEADERGRWGARREFGGRFVPETLVSALIELERAYAAVRHDPRFWAELRELGIRYVGRPSPLYRADRLSTALLEGAGRAAGVLRLYLKREDLNHTGAHKITNALGQVLLTRALGKTRVIAETGAGQHGVATATACALLDLPCVVYMGAEDIRRQSPNVLRMRALGADVRSVTSGTQTLKDAINEAMRDWVTNVATTHYVLGSAVGPHPYPTLVRDLQRVIGDEAAAQVIDAEGRLPDAVIACVGGGSNAIGLFSRFIGETAVRLVGVEAAGEGMATGRHAAALAGGSPGILHGARSYLLQDADGQVQEAHSISAGLDYPGIGPQLSALYAAGRLEILGATDAQALHALRLVTRSEGILPALEPAHAIAALGRLLAETGPRRLADDALVLVGLSGRGDKDLGVLETDA